MIERFGPMRRDGDETESPCRLMVNCHPVDDGRTSLVKIPGYAVSVDDVSIGGGGTIGFGHFAFYKNPDVAAFVDERLVMLFDDGLYYYDGADWVLIVWRGISAPSFGSDPRFWFEDGRLHVTGGNGFDSGVLMFVDREKDTDLNGFFENAVGFVGLWWGPEDLPVFDTDTITITVIEADGGGTKFLLYNTDYYLLPVFVCGGEQSRPGDYVSFKTGNDVAKSYFAVVEIKIPVDDVDRRVTAIELYLGKGGHKADLMRKVSQYERPKTGDLDIATIDWRYFRRIDINHRNVIWSGISVGVDDVDHVKIDGAAGVIDAFPTDSLNDFFGIRIKVNPGDSWINGLCLDTELQAGLTKIKVTQVVVVDTAYITEIYGKMLVLVDDVYVYDMVRYSGENGAVSELGNPFATTQPWSIVSEFFPSYAFAVTQDKRTLRLDVTTDERHRNRVILSEVNKSSVTPNGNERGLNTLPGETAKGLAGIGSGFLAFFERSCHVIRMTAEPMVYDGEEGRFEFGCLSRWGVVGFDEMVFFPSVDGWRMFRQGFVNLTEMRLDGFWRELIASEAAGNGGSYDGICSGYSHRDRVVLLGFPNSTFSVDGFVVRLLGYYVVSGDVFIVDCDRVFDYFYPDYSGGLYGLSGEVIYELFAGSPTELNKLVFRSGIIGREDVVIDRIRLTYKGRLSVNFYSFRGSSPAVVCDEFPEKASVGSHELMANMYGDDVQVEIEGVAGVGEAEVGGLRVLGL